MTMLKRIVPQNIEAVYRTLQMAKFKLGATAPANNPLRPATTTRLNNILTALHNAITLRQVAKAHYNNNTPKKDALRENCQLLVLHFIQVFNLCVARKKFKAGERAYFQLNVDSDRQPLITTESGLLQWARFLIAGEAARQAKGLAPMTNPDIAEVEAAFTLFQASFLLQSTLKDELDNKQEAVEALMPEARRVVKKVWDELETFYNEEDRESARNNCREWGVIYQRTGYSKTLKGAVHTGEVPWQSLTIGFENGRKKVPLQPSGGFEITTTLMGKQTIVVQQFNTGNKALRQWRFTVELKEDAEVQHQSFVLE